MMTHQQQPNTNNIPENLKNVTLHARIEIGNAVLMGADIPHAEPMRSAYLSLRLDTPQEAESIYKLLSEGGQVFMKMEETFLPLALPCSETSLARPGCFFMKNK
jgi:PhnB protein